MQDNLETPEQITIAYFEAMLAAGYIEKVDQVDHKTGDEMYRMTQKTYDKIASLDSAAESKTNHNLSKEDFDQAVDSLEEHFDEIWDIVLPPKTVSDKPRNGGSPVKSQAKGKSKKIAP